MSDLIPRRERLTLKRDMPDEDIPWLLLERYYEQITGEVWKEW